MAVNKDFKDLLQCLNREKAEFIIVGAYAVMFYTEPRYTKDIDLWVNPTKDNADKVFQALKNFGAPIRDLTPQDLTNKKNIYQIGIEPNRADIIMDIAGTKFNLAWKNKVRTVYDDEKIYVLDIKNLLKAKKKAGRPQDIVDIEKLELALTLRKKSKKPARKKKK